MKRLPVNLASNPIEHRRWLRRITLSIVGAALVLTLVHAVLVVSVLDTPQAPPPDAEALAELRYRASQVLDMVSNTDPTVARRLAISAGLANALIEQRVFPWAGLFRMLEQTLPDDVRLEVIQPLTTVEGVTLTLTAASSSGDALLEFLAALEQRPELLAVYPGRQMVGADGDLRLSIEAVARIGGVAAGAEEPAP